MINITFSETFLKSLDNQTPNIRLQIKQKLQFLIAQNNPMFWAVKIKGTKDYYRFRAGNYRIAFKLESNTIILLLVANRKDIYQGL